MDGPTVYLKYTKSNQFFFSGYIYIYIYRERERERESRNNKKPVILFLTKTWLYDMPIACIPQIFSVFNSYFQK